MFVALIWCFVQNKSTPCARTRVGEQIALCVSASIMKHHNISHSEYIIWSNVLAKPKNPYVLRSSNHLDGYVITWPIAKNWRILPWITQIDLEMACVRPFVLNSINKWQSRRNSEIQKHDLCFTCHIFCKINEISASNMSHACVQYLREDWWEFEENEW